MGFAAVAALVMALAVSARAAPVLELNVGGEGADGTVGLGEMVAVEVTASGVPTGSDGNGMFGFGFSILFPSTALSASSPTTGPLFSSTGFEDSRNDPGDVGLTADRFFYESGPFGDDILLGTIIFEGLQLGVHDLNLTYFTGVGDNILFDGQILDASSAFFTSGTITVIPEPSTLSLVLLGGLAFVAHRWSRTRSGT